MILKRNRIKRKAVCNYASICWRRSTGSETEEFPETICKLESQRIQFQAKLKHVHVPSPHSEHYHHVLQHDPVKNSFK